MAGNSLVGTGDKEIGYVNKSNVEGESFEIGATVVYEGREMTVSRAPDSDGDIKMKTLADLSGFLAFCGALPQIKQLKELKCGLSRFPPNHLAHAAIASSACDTDLKPPQNQIRHVVR